MKKRLTAPFLSADDLSALRDLRTGDSVLLSGVIYTARDAAHQRLLGLLAKGEALPFDLRGAAIYYCGPTPAPPGRPVGSIGPTTSYRMDSFAPALYERGLAASIGKGPRGAAVKEALCQSGGVYFAATGGAAALLASCVKEAKLIAFPDLGPEAVYELKVEDFPLLVATDAQGGDLY
ncbi:MAG: FumA C-terminus/TtdB family hydratase beta subunit [Deltaproteobacteria bacterium]|jgi:fumarate hydratase subunit beta|nr:FumA C-terminus/TtdB family hydratase beta subunit [Deltaproteobacteria bacterium]